MSSSVAVAVAGAGVAGAAGGLLGLLLVLLGLLLALLVLLVLLLLLLLLRLIAQLRTVIGPDVSNCQKRFVLLPLQDLGKHRLLCTPAGCLGDQEG